MTPAAALLDRLRESGISVILRADGKLWLQPMAALTSELLDAAKAHRDELVRLLATNPPADPAPLPEAESKRTAEQLDRVLSEDSAGTVTPSQPQNGPATPAIPCPECRDPSGRARSLGDACA